MLTTSYHNLKMQDCSSDSDSGYRLPPRDRWEQRSSGVLLREMVISYRRFGTTYRSHLQGSRSKSSSGIRNQKKTFGFNSPEERRFQGCYIFKYFYFYITHVLAPKKNLIFGTTGNRKRIVKCHQRLTSLLTGKNWSRMFKYKRIHKLLPACSSQLVYY